MSLNFTSIFTFCLLIMYIWKNKKSMIIAKNWRNNSFDHYVQNWYIETSKMYFKIRCRFKILFTNKIILKVLVSIIKLKI